MGVDPATMMMASAVVSSAGAIHSAQNQRAALQRENVRLEQERRLAELQAIEQENIRKEMLNQTLADNLAFQSASGYYDDSRSFLNINKQATIKAEKDFANIRLNAKVVDVKYRDQMFENNISAKSAVFGGYISAIAGLTTGYANYDFYKTPKKKKLKFGVDYETTYGANY